MIRQDSKLLYQKQLNFHFRIFGKVKSCRNDNSLHFGTGMRPNFCATKLYRASPSVLIFKQYLAVANSTVSLWCEEQLPCAIRGKGFVHHPLRRLGVRGWSYIFLQCDLSQWWLKLLRTIQSPLDQWGTPRITVFLVRNILQILLSRDSDAMARIVRLKFEFTDLDIIFSRACSSCQTNSRRTGRVIASGVKFNFATARFKRHFSAATSPYGRRCEPPSWYCWYCLAVRCSGTDVLHVFIDPIRPRIQFNRLHRYQGSGTRLIDRRALLAMISSLLQPLIREFSVFFNDFFAVLYRSRWSSPCVRHQTKVLDTSASIAGTMRSIIRWLLLLNQRSWRLDQVRSRQHHHRWDDKAFWTSFT